jgi:hypothetical protein
LEYRFVKDTHRCFLSASRSKGLTLQRTGGNKSKRQLSNLIDQQEAMPPQPQFAQTYVLLGDQYKKTGQPDYAVQTWRLGLAKFPADSNASAKNYSAVTRSIETDFTPAFRVSPVAHSYRSATIGSIFVARRAGI